MNRLSSRSLLAFGLPLLLAACGMPTTDADIKFAGVGLNPDEIGATPTQSGGFIEYNWVEFAGGLLSLSALGLLSFDEAGPGMVGFEPPYAIVSGTGFIFDTDQPNPDALFGSFARPPDVVGTCHTVYEPQSYLSTVADVGNAITLQTPDASAGFAINRRPYVYPPVVQDIFPYYSELASWRATPWTHRVPTGDGTSLGDMSEEILARPNFPFGQTLNVTFPGGLPPAEATYNSIPVPLSSANADATVVLPQQPKGFMLEWTGPRFDAATRSWTGEGEDHATCLSFAQHDLDPSSPADCLTLQEPPSDGKLTGQVYTAPWKTDGGLTLRWEPEADATDTISVSIRFLGQIDETDSYLVKDAVTVAPDGTLQADWNNLVEDGLVPDGSAMPQGSRASLACDDESDVDWIFNPAFHEGDGGYIPTLQGDPLHTVAEVMCTLDPGAGEFTITEDMLGSALSFADQYQAGGAIFYVARTQSKLLDVPAVRDWVGQRRDVAPVTVVSKAVQVGRFWYDR